MTEKISKPVVSSYGSSYGIYGGNQLKDYKRPKDKDLNNKDAKDVNEFKTFNKTIKDYVLAKLGHPIIDVELETENLTETVKLIKGKTKCLLSSHQLTGTPSLDRLKGIVERQLAVGADICKVVTTAQSLKDNLTVLQLITEFPKSNIVSFAMGSLGSVSRILCPLVGGYFTYASIEEGKESAPGQIRVGDLRRLYEMME